VTRESELQAFAELQAELGQNSPREMPVDVAEQLDEPAKPKRKKRVTPKERSLRECRRRGWTAGDVERRIPFPRPRGTTFDLFGVIDIVALVVEIDTAKSYMLGDEPVRRAVSTIGIQACPGDRHADHRAKILAEPRARQWLEVPGNRLELWSWSKHGAHFERPHWDLRVEVFTLDSAWLEQEVDERVDEPADEGDGDE
jgi:hypothetical protein